MKYPTLLLVALLICAASGSKILAFFPFLSKSHVILGSALLKGLAKRGHEVTMVSAFPLEQEVANYTDIELKGVQEIMEKKFQEIYAPNQNAISSVFNIFKIVEAVIATVIENEHFIKLCATNDTYDLVLLQWGAGALAVLGHELNAPTVGFSVLGTNIMNTIEFNHPLPYSYVPNVLLPFTDEMTFFQRVLNTVSNICMELLHNYIAIPRQRALLNKHFPHALSLDAINQDIDLMLVNSHVAFESARPYLPNMIQIGGFHLYEEVTLPKDVADFLDSAKTGAVYFNLGSNLKSKDLPAHKLEAILATFRKLDMKVLWKFEATMPDKPKNVMVQNWLPQRAILAHPNVKLFITHGGLGGTTESIFYGIPMLGVPVINEQKMNVANLVRKGCALELNLDNLDEASFTRSIHEILDDPIYSKNAKLQSDIFKNQEMNPMDKATYWIEHVIKHKGAKHLKSAGSKLPFYKYMLIDVFIFLIAVITTPIILTVFAIKFYRKRKYRKEKLY